MDSDSDNTNISDIESDKTVNKRENVNTDDRDSSEEYGTMNYKIKKNEKKLKKFDKIRDDLINFRQLMIDNVEINKKLYEIRRRLNLNDETIYEKLKEFNKYNDIKISLENEKENELKSKNEYMDSYYVSVFGDDYKEFFFGCTIYDMYKYGGGSFIKSTINFENIRKIQKIMDDNNKNDPDIGKKIIIASNGTCKFGFVINTKKNCIVISDNEEYYISKPCIVKILETLLKCEKS